METFLAMFLVLMAYLSVTAKAFLPRINLLATEDSTTLDHALITKDGFLKPLIYFLRDNQKYLRDEYLTGFLYDIFRSNSPNPLKDTIENISPQIQFLNALNEIQSANVEVDSFPLCVVQFYLLPSPPGHTPGKTHPVWPGGREFPQVVLPGGRGAGQIKTTTRARTYGVTQWRLLEPRGKGHVFRFSHFVNLQLES